MSNIVHVRPGDIVLFWDDRFPVEEVGLRPAAGDVNCVAVVVGEQGALFIGKSILGRRIERIPLAAISSLKNVQIRRLNHGNLEDQIAAYFLAHSRSPSAFKAGLAALREDNLSPFHLGTFFPKRPRYKTADEHERAWTSFVATLKPMDAIFTVDTHSVVSRFIAWATRGSWSHVATYLGDGEISEVVTTGLRRAPLATYKRPQYRVAAYRHIGAVSKPVSRERALAAERAGTRRFLPGRYNYRKAIYYGWRAFLDDHDHALVPNSQIYTGIFVFIAQV